MTHEFHSNMCEPDCLRCPTSFDLNEFIEVCSDNTNTDDLEDRPVKRQKVEAVQESQDFTPPIKTYTKRTRYNSKNGFEKCQQRYEVELGHTLVDTLESWLANKYQTFSTPPVLCGKCGSRCEKVRINDVMHGQNIGCVRCRTVSKRRAANKFPCNGLCGREGCTFVATVNRDLRRHTSSERFPCPICERSSSIKTKMYKHFRSKHEDQLSEDGSCEKHGVPPRAEKSIKLPTSYKDKVSPQNYKMLTINGGYSWLVSKVKRLVMNDIKKTKFTKKMREYSRSLSKDNRANHDIAKQILDILIEKQMFDKSAIDDAGGRLPNGFVLRTHGGVFALTLDRKNNDHPHFLEGQPVTANLNFVASGMNNRANIVSRYGNKTCEVLRKKVAEQHSAEEVNRILQRARLRDHCKNGERFKNTLHVSCNCAFYAEKKYYKKYLQNPNKYTPEKIAAMKQFREDFPTAEHIFQYVLQLFDHQEARCAISGILIDNDLDAPDCFFPSLDAINPRKHHVKGNLRIVCRFLNSTNHDKQKQYEHPDDLESAWKTDSFMSYIGL